MPSNQAYFQRPGVSSHALIELARSPLHGWAKYVDPDRADEEPTARAAVRDAGACLGLDAGHLRRRVRAGGFHQPAHDSRQGRLRRAGGVGPAGRHGQGIPGGLGDRQGDPAASRGRDAVQNRRAGKNPHRGARTAPVTAQGAVGLAESAAGHRRTQNRDRRQPGRFLARRLPARLPPVGGLLPDAGERGDRERRKPPSRTPLSWQKRSIPMPWPFTPRRNACWRKAGHCGSRIYARFDECWINDDWPSYPVESLEPATGTSGGPRFEVEEGELEL